MIQRRQTLLIFAGCLLGGNEPTTRAFSWQYQQPIGNKIQPRRNEQIITSRIHRTCYHTECRRKLLLSISGGNTADTKHNNNNNNNNIRGIIKMAASSLSFSVMFLGVKLFSDAPTFTLIFYRSVVQSILSGIMIRKNKMRDNNASTTTETSADPSTHDDDKVEIQILLILRAVFGSFAVAAFFYAVQNLPLPDAITLQFTTPVFAALLAVPLLNEKWKRSDQVGAVICLIGVLLIARPSWLFGTVATATSSTSIATLVGLGGAVFAGLAYVLVRKIGSRANANTMVLYYALISTVTAPLGSKYLGGSNTWNTMKLQPADASSCTPTQQLLVFLTLGIFGFMGQLFTNQGLQLCESAAVATLVTNTQIVFAFLFEISILKEGLSPWSLIGTSLIVGYMAFTGSKMIQKEREKSN